MSNAIYEIILQIASGNSQTLEFMHGLDMLFSFEPFLV
jgi:hypothetical protein